MPDDAFRLDFGRHKGKTLAEVEADDPTYLTWLIQNARMRGKGEAYLAAKKQALAMLARLEAAPPKRRRSRE